MSVLAWLGHSNFQPIWKSNRYHTSCRACGRELRPTGQERVANFAMPALGIGIAIGLSATFHLSERPYDLWILFPGLIAGMLAQYPIAKYELVDSGDQAELPSARTTEDQHRG